MAPAAYSVLTNRKDLTMKFTVNREAFFEAIKPAMEVAGRIFGKYNIEKYSRMTHECLNGYLNVVKNAIDSSISELSQNDKYTIPTRGNNAIQKKVCAYIINDFEKLKRITFEAYQNRIQVSASNGDIVLSIEISGKDLTAIHYQCEEEGILTVESARLWVFLASVDQCDRISISSEGDWLVKIESEQGKDAVRRFEKLTYHANPIFTHDPIYVGTIPIQMLIDGLRSVMFATHSKHSPDNLKAIIVCISPNHLRFIGSNGSMFSVCDIHSAQSISEKKICFALSSDIFESLIKTLRAMKGGDIEIYRGSKSRTGNKPWDILIKQNNAVLSFKVRNTDKYKSAIESILDTDYKYRASTKAEEWISILNSLKPSRFKADSIMSIKADFIEGNFHVEISSNRGRIVSYIPFSYEAGFFYIDAKSIKNEEVSINTHVTHLASIFKNTKPDDILTFEFGRKKSVTKKKKPKHFGNWCLVSYPSKVNKSTGYRQELFAMFQVNARKDNSND